MRSLFLTHLFHLLDNPVPLYSINRAGDGATERKSCKTNRNSFEKAGLSVKEISGLASDPVE